MPAICIRIMKNCLVISDLSFLQDIDNSNITGGYVSAYGFTSTRADPGSADATAGAFASGDNTYTNTKAKTRVKKTGYLDYSNAEASAVSYASSDNQSAFYKSYSGSTSITLDYS